MEVRRRGEVLRPLGAPDWKLLSANLARAHASTSGNNVHSPKPSAISLTDKILIDVCADSELGFVIAKENVGFNPLVHLHPGAFNAWNLYDCRHVRSMAPSA